jgi:hypothetical protein
MVSARFRIVALTLAGLLGCGSDPQPQATTAAPSATMQAAGTTAKTADAAPLSQLPEKKFGAAITETADTPLEAIVRDPGSFKDKTLRTTGVVTAVCQHMGCWMEIGDAEKKAHIKMAGHSFFVPKNASGHHAIVQGKLTGADPLASACDHEGADSCGGEANGVVAKLEIEAAGVEFID